MELGLVWESELAPVSELALPLVWELALPLVWELVSEEDCRWLEYLMREQGARI